MKKKKTTERQLEKFSMLKSTKFSKVLGYVLKNKKKMGESFLLLVKMKLTYQRLVKKTKKENGK